MRDWLPSAGFMQSLPLRHSAYGHCAISRYLGEELGAAISRFLFLSRTGGGDPQGLRGRPRNMPSQREVAP